MKMDNIKSMIKTLKGYPSCAHLSPPYIASILDALASCRVVRLGIFNSTVEGERAAADISVCSDASVSIILFAVNHGSYMNTVVIFQMVHEDMCSQVYVKSGFSSERGIFFTDSSRKVIREVGAWA